MFVSNGTGGRPIYSGGPRCPDQVGGQGFADSVPYLPSDKSDHKTHSVGSWAIESVTAFLSDSRKVSTCELTLRSGMFGFTVFSFFVSAIGCDPAYFQGLQEIAKTVGSVRLVFLGCYLTPNLIKLWNGELFTAEQTASEKLKNGLSLISTSLLSLLIFTGLTGVDLGKTHDVLSHISYGLWVVGATSTLISSGGEGKDKYELIGAALGWTYMVCYLSNAQSFATAFVGLGAGLYSLWMIGREEEEKPAKVRPTRADVGIQVTQN